jgi:hypothetical protein
VVYTRKLILTFIIVVIFFNFSITTADYNLKSELYKYQNNFEMELPLWQVGNIWNYYIKLEGSPYASITVDAIISNFYVEVISENEYSFKLNISGFVQGIISTGEINGEFRETSFEGFIIMDKNNLSVNIVEIEVNGKVVVGLIPIPLNINIDLKCSPNYSSIDFPLFVGKQWKTQTSSINGFVNISTIFDSISIFLIAGGGTSQCLGIENISIQSGIFEAFKIINTMDINEIYYSKNVGNIIKLYGSNYDFENITLELKYTNYIEPGSPNKPEKPLGETRGKIGINYNFTSRTYDLENDDIFLLWDWDDGINSDWIGPYKNNETVIASHIWNSNGSYNIKVKAKDIFNHQSPWSDPLVISMPKNRSYNHIPRIMIWLSERFPFLQPYFHYFI